MGPSQPVRRRLPRRLRPTPLHPAPATLSRRRFLVKAVVSPASRRHPAPGTVGPGAPPELPRNTAWSIQAGIGGGREGGGFFFGASPAEGGGAPGRRPAAPGSPPGGPAPPPPPPPT